MVTCAFQVIDGSVDLLVRDQAYKDSISVVLSGMLRAWTSWCKGWIQINTKKKQADLVRELAQKKGIN